MKFVPGPIRTTAQPDRPTHSSGVVTTPVIPRLIQLLIVSRKALTSAGSETEYTELILVVIW